MRAPTKFYIILLHKYSEWCEVIQRNLHLFPKYLKKDLCHGQDFSTFFNHIFFLRELEEEDEE